MLARRVRSFDPSPDKSYFIRDDELTSLTRRQHDISLLESLLTRAYMVVDTTTNPAPVISWMSPLTPDALNGITRLANSDAYWSVPLVLAFECNIPGNSPFENEHDNHKPDNVVASSGILGLTCGGGAHCQDAADGPIAATFTETIRDFGWTDRSSIKPTVPVDEIYGSDGAHEVLHTLSLWHNGGIMCSTRKNNASDQMHDKITDLQVSILRKIPHPKTSVDRSDECGFGFTDPNCCPPPPTK